MTTPYLGYLPPHWSLFAPLGQFFLLGQELHHILEFQVILEDLGLPHLTTQGPLVPLLGHKPLQKKRQQPAQVMCFTMLKYIFFLS